MDAGPADRELADRELADREPADRASLDLLHPDRGDLAERVACDAARADQSSVADRGSDDVGRDAAFECSDGDAGPGCDGLLRCCQGRCVDLADDPRHCGSCGVACSATQFCLGLAGCDELGFTRLCANPARTALQTGFGPDDVILQASASAVASHCGGEVQLGSQYNVALVDQASYAPRIGVGHTLLLHGGPYLQRVLHHFEDSGASPLRYRYEAATDSNGFVRQDSSTLQLNVPAALSTPAHDYFLVELFADPQRGALVLASYGFDLPGSRAAGWYLVHRLLGAPEPRPRWVIVEWTDGDGDFLPGSADTFTELSSDLD